MADLKVRVETFLQTRLRPGDSILAAVSGGPDSVALAHLLRGLPYRLILAHVDHRLRRGSASDRRFVQKLAGHWDLRCVTASVDVGSHARKKGQGIEEAARELRYRALERMARRLRCGAVATGHHADDQAETVLMNLLRGAGGSGLAGMPPERSLSPRSPEIKLLRPLLGTWRREILVYLRKHRLSSRRDPSNRSLDFRRNRIRHKALPYLNRLAPGFSQRLVQAAEFFRAEEGFWETITAPKLSKTARKFGQSVDIDLKRLLGYHKALKRRILRHFLPGLSFLETESVLALASSPDKSRSLHLGNGLVVNRRSGRLVVARNT